MRKNEQAHSVTYRTIILLLVLLIILKLGIGLLYERGIFDRDILRYRHSVSKINAINGEMLITILEENCDEPVIIYMGRETCPECIMLLPKVSAALAGNKKTADGLSVKQYYLDTDRNNTELVKKMREEIGARYVPSVIVVVDKTVEVFDAESIWLEDFPQILERCVSK